MLYRFIKSIQRRKLLTLLLENIFDYKNIHDYNYIFRIINEKDQIIIDIYDNVSDNRFNRYIFSFDKYQKKTNYTNNNVFITYINVFDIEKINNKLDMFGYLFTLDNDKMVGYALTFLDERIVEVLKKQVNL